MSTLEQLARAGHGAIQVDLPAAEPVKVVLAGPIKHWWTLPADEWGTGEHGRYVEWRDAVETAFVQAGFLVYSPHKAWRGAWSEAAQYVNDAAIAESDALVNLTPPGIPNRGTREEIDVARSIGVTVVDLPPGTAADIDTAIARLSDEPRGDQETCSATHPVGGWICRRQPHPETEFHRTIDNNRWKDSDHD